MLAYVRNNLYLCKGKDSRGVATRRQGQTDSLSLLSFVGKTNNVGSMEQEIWKPIKGFEGLYEVSNLGRVRSHVYSNTYANKVGEVILKHDTSARGYHRITLFKDKQKTRVRVHRLVAEAFIPNPENKPYIDHINTDVNDNKVTNLRWSTPKENSNNAITLSRIREDPPKAMKTRIKNGSRGASRPVYQFSLQGELLKVWESCVSAERGTGILNINKAIMGKAYTAGGFQWSYNKDIAPYTPPIRPAKRVAMFTKEMELIKVFQNAKEAANILGFARKRIHSCCSGHETSCNGYKFQYYTE